MSRNGRRRAAMLVRRDRLDDLQGVIVLERATGYAELDQALRRHLHEIGDLIDAGLEDPAREALQMAAAIESELGMCPRSR